MKENKNDYSAVTAIEEMSSENCNIDDIFDKLVSLYQSTYRHQYSEIYMAINMLAESEINLERIEVNLDKLMVIVENQSDLSSSIKQSFNKLFDYTVLEIGRNRNINEANSSGIEKIEQLEKDVSEKVSKISEIANTTEKKLKDYQSTIFTVVGLLVSIVPLLTINVQFVSSDIEITNIMMSNGIIFLGIATIFFIILSMIDEKKLWMPVTFFLLGAFLIYLAYGKSLGVWNICEMIELFFKTS